MYINKLKILKIYDKTSLQIPREKQCKALITTTLRLNSKVQHQQDQLRQYLGKYRWVLVANGVAPQAQFSGFFKWSILYLLAADKLATKDLVCTEVFV